MMLIDLVAKEAQLVLDDSHDLVARIVNTRKSIEVWHHLETYKRFLRGYRDLSIKLECVYPGTQERCDFWVQEHDTTESWIELKCCVTNYCKNQTEIGVTRPITNQIAGILADGNKLLRITKPGAHLHIFLLAYPLPVDYRNHREWKGHLERLRVAGMHVSEAFSISVVCGGKPTNVVAYRCDIGTASAR